MPRYTLQEALRDLRQNVRLEHETIVVCNGQESDLVGFVTASDQIDKYCLNSVNVGVARAWNMGAELAEGEVLCFVNDDVEVGEGAVERLFEALSSAADVGQVGPRGARWRGAEHDRFVGETEIEEADAISGFFFMIKSDVFRDVGGFDIAYTPAGFEEIDMSFKIRRAGKKCLVVPKLAITHHHHHGVSAYSTTIQYLSTSIDTRTLHERNKAYFNRKWFPGDQ
ncbi:MAG: glycosyltransferase family 2 protein [Sulfuricaulis sp.]